MGTLIEIIVIGVIAYLYYSTAKEKNRDTITWIIVGVVCYYLPIFIMNKVLWQFIPISGWFIISLINIIIGASFSMAVKKSVLDQR